MQSDHASTYSLLLLLNGLQRIYPKTPLVEVSLPVSSSYSKKQSDAGIGPDKVDFKKLEQIHKDLFTDLLHISANIEGEFTMTKEAEVFINDWYKRTADKPTVPDPRLVGYHERKPAYVFKVAMLCHLAYSDELLLNKHDFDQAISILGQVEGKMLQTFQAIGRNPHSLDIDSIREFVEAQENGIKPAVLKKHFQHVATPHMLDELIDFLLSCGDMIETNSNGVIHYTAKR